MAYSLCAPHFLLRPPPNSLAVAIPVVAIAVVEIRRPGPNVAMAHTVDAATAKVEEEEQAAVVVPPSVRCSPHIILNDGEWTLPVPIDFHRR